MLVILGAYRRPGSETPLTWKAFTLAGLLDLRALSGHGSPLLYAYPAFFVVMGSAVLAAIGLGRRRARRAARLVLHPAGRRGQPDHRLPRGPWRARPLGPGSSPAAACPVPAGAPGGRRDGTPGGRPPACPPGHYPSGPPGRGRRPARRCPPARRFPGPGVGSQPKRRRCAWPSAGNGPAGVTAAAGAAPPPAAVSRADVAFACQRKGLLRLSRPRRARGFRPTDRWVWITANRGLSP